MVANTWPSYTDSIRMDTGCENGKKKRCLKCTLTEILVCFEVWSLLFRITVNFLPMWFIVPSPQKQIILFFKTYVHYLKLFLSQTFNDHLLTRIFNLTFPVNLSLSSEFCPHFKISNLFLLYRFTLVYSVTLYPQS